ncbi:MAG: hypothetical protein BGO98_35380 [Myxococcales bacterium 68-20]|nr:FHA domain-containing protein [Myxococcales bacterium]OJY25881.1 MAG: hypothetical protein BGO98_35380 [Myxococcales bacterium 68-20]
MMTDEARLQRWLDSRRDAHPSADHIDVDTLARHAAGQLHPEMARAVNEHLAACEDGRCGDYVRSREASIEPARDHYAEAGTPADRSRDRTFQSRAIVWSTFESMAREMDVSVDELVNEAMAAYASARGYVVAAPEPRVTAAAPRRPSAGEDNRELFAETHDALGMTPLDRSYAPPRAQGGPDDDLARTEARGAFARPGAGRPPPSWDGPDSRTKPRMSQGGQRSAPQDGGPRGFGEGRAASKLPPPVPPDGGSSRSVVTSAMRVPPPPARSSGALPPPLPLTPPPRMPPGAQRVREAAREAPSGARQLMLEYRGRAYPVEKERFLLGRSKTQADLRLDDPNVSRQHAVIERVGAAFYIVDLGSTNGVHIGGERVTRRALSDGDMIVITTHEIRCTLR